MHRILAVALAGTMGAAPLAVTAGAGAETGSAARTGAAGDDPVAAVRIDPPAWRPCGEHGAECGSVRVPLDWSRPRGRRITLAVSRLRAAAPSRRIGAVFFNPGGPGGKAMAIVRDVPGVFPEELRNRFDVIGLDPRGVGASVPAIACEKPTLDPRIGQFPRTAAQYRRLVSYNREVGAGCRRATGPLIDHVDTVSAARDVEAVRVALGGGKLNWLGLSYGTLLGATYAELYPHRVRAAVLDGAVDHSLRPRRMVADEAAATEEAFARFARWCDADRACAMHGRDVRAEYRALLARARRHPVPAKGHPEGVTAEQIGYGVYSLLTVPAQTRVRLAGALAGATAAVPDAAGFAEPVDSSPAYRAITCHDFPSDVRGPADLAAREREANRVAPTTGGYVEGWDVQAGCIGWPVRAANPWGPTPVRGAPPLLVVSGENDPATPYPWGVGLARQIQGSRLLSWRGTGHTAYLNDEAVRGQEIRYLIDPNSPLGTVRG
ncbi:alpha/beta hydrolase [Actinomadura roseirufa]|uniref:alpha/beta hydrolase n=1 Tax=Actinomadura roseirufa TaxID=2094049 RepID=UPI001A956131|nr:alpha/beta hydrolase [Actinomadura roseirufa]